MSAFTPIVFADDKGLPPNSRAKSRVPWPYALACCLYYLFAYRALASATPIFAKLLKDLGVALPLPTHLLMASYSWFFPLLFVGAVILTLAKQFVPLEKPLLRMVNLFLVFAGVVFPPLVVLAWYWPLFDLIWKLQSAR